jgi:hypothetical protein
MIEMVWTSLVALQLALNPPTTRRSDAENRRDMADGDGVKQSNGSLNVFTDGIITVNGNADRISGIKSSPSIIC